MHLPVYLKQMAFSNTPQVRKNLLKWSKSRGFTQEKLAQELGLSQSSVSKFIKGTGGTNKLNAYKVLKLFNISIEEFLK